MLECLWCACFLTQYDEHFASEGNNFVAFDFNQPLSIPSELHHTFDFIVIDPPFITKEVWEKYTVATQLLLRSYHGRVLLSTIGTCVLMTRTNWIVHVVTDSMSFFRQQKKTRR